MYSVSGYDGFVRFEELTTSGAGGLCDAEWGASVPAFGGLSITNCQAVSFNQCLLKGMSGGVDHGPFNNCCSDPATGLKTTNSNVTLYRTTITVGQGYLNCPDAPLYEKTGGNLWIHNGPSMGPRDYKTTSPLRRNEFGTMEFDGEVGDYVLLLFSLKPGMAQLGGVNGTLLLDGPFNGVFLLGTLTGPTLSVPVGFGDLPPAGIDAVDIPLQAGFISAGGDGFLGPMSVITVLDPGF